MREWRLPVLGFVLAVHSTLGHAQPAPGGAKSDAFASWTLLSTPNALGTPRKADRVLSSSDITHSIAKAQTSPIFEPGWNLSSDETNATLIYAHAANAASIGFVCRKGDGFVTFRSPTPGAAPKKHVLVQLRSKNGTIRIEAGAGPDRIIASESPVRTSSLVFVLTPKIEPHRLKKKGAASDEPRLIVGGWSTQIPAGTGDVKLLRFQTLCDQPVASAE